MTGLAVFAAVLLAYALVSRRLELSAISAPMVFVAAGIVAGPDVLGLVELDATHGTAFHIAELTLAILLFADAARIDPRSLRADAGLPGRLLGVGMPLTILLGMAAGAALLTELEFWEAAIVAAVLAPTDAALGQAVVSDRRVPQRIRRGLGVESGLNDGLSVPFLALIIALAAEQTVPDARDWLGFAVDQIGLGTVIGAVVGGAGVLLVERFATRRLSTPLFERFGVLALAALAFLGWFGPRGLASIILALVVAEEEPELPALGAILATMTVTVLASVVLHGVSARPLVLRTYGSGSVRGA
jgi:NhaP-type Na+/H+ or K+/H+ antiporter